jgi:hypothetical protein
LREQKQSSRHNSAPPDVGLPEPSPGQPSDLDLVLIHRSNLYRGTVEQRIKLAPTCLALSQGGSSN